MKIWHDILLLKSKRENDAYHLTHHWEIPRHPNKYGTVQIHCKHGKYKAVIPKNLEMY